ncbi:MAG: hypothetical protein LBN98_04500 [Prevotellaceae bacterium]|jgi:hypothetical protein|nr:hypothetical protein [Prevotellaceae bacterium]
MKKFLSFFDPFFAYIDTGKIFRKPFAWLYGLFALFNVLLPFIILYWMISGELFSLLSAGQIFGLILLWLVIVVGAWFSVLLWWNRLAKVSNLTGDKDDFVVTPAFAHLMQTFGEWLGGYVAIVGCLSALLSWLFLPSDVVAQLFSTLGLGGLFGMGAAGIVVAPLYGFLILIVFRYAAELSRALACIANNTKKN